jgi:hypothetical protein
VKSLLQRLPEQPSRAGGQDWDERVAREVEHQRRIEAAFDRADSCRAAGDHEQALAWRREADALSGELAPAYAEKGVGA